VIGFPEPYRPPQLSVSEQLVTDPDRPVNYPVFEERYHYLATVHGFTAGGFECTVRRVDVQAMVDARMRTRGHRKPVSERDEADMLRAVKRSKKMVRLCVKEIGCNHLLTLTTREDINSPESLARQWKAFVRRWRFFTGQAFHYVAVPERHPKNPNHWHLHVAIVGGLYGVQHIDGTPVRRLELARRLWRHSVGPVSGQKSSGNIDIKRIRVGCHTDGSPKGPLVVAERIARYISKYITKDLLFSHRADKKRYWRSEYDVPEARHYWLATPVDGVDSLSASFAELRERLGGFGFVNCSFFEFPDGSGYWLSYNPDTTFTEGFAQPPPF
jgi:hypothetical protein